MVDFKKIEEFLDSGFDDEKAKEIIAKAQFTDDQLHVINTLIVAALRAYDCQKQN